MLGKLENCSYQNRNAALGLKVHVVFEGEPHKGAAKLKRWYRVFFRGMQRYVYRCLSPGFIRRLQLHLPAKHTFETK